MRRCPTAVQMARYFEFEGANHLLILRRRCAGVRPAKTTALETLMCFGEPRGLR
ncbi:hypothetical protein FIBSPDRAFT_65810 [Athelia psychrophila]|uniref:Uncharacterized protein n=1 Tax=Athelia psychrophila TaxID=1759441 RepID=A0A166EXQ0_9AGAM|nr:hypothetical protein FIBSPDRAFT_65810 [Fibularhizoctonia sp. CBS 109695]